MQGVGFDIGSFLFWLLLLMIFLSPTLQYKSLKAARLKLIRHMEQKYNFRVITMIHRQERIGIFGIPVYRFIDIEDSEEILRAIRTTPPNKPIALVLHTPGGLILAATQIALALKRHPAKKIVIVPHYAMSGGTLIALAADEIWMDRCAVLGPVDPQIATQQGIHLPAPSILKVVKEKGKEASDQTLILADVAEKALKEVQEIIKKLLEGKVPPEKAEEIAKTLTEGKWTHDYPLTFDEVKELGLPVKENIPPEVYSLMDLYPQAHQHRPGIEYLPYPRYPVPSIDRHR